MKMLKELNLLKPISLKVGISIIELNRINPISIIENDSITLSGYIFDAEGDYINIDEIVRLVNDRELTLKV